MNLLLLLIGLISIPAGAWEQTATATPLMKTPLPEGVGIFVPPRVDWVRVRKSPLQGKANLDLIVSYGSRLQANPPPSSNLPYVTSVVEVLGRQGRKYTLLWRKEFDDVWNPTAQSVRLDPRDPIPLLFVEGGIGASIGGNLEIDRWNGKAFQKLCGIHEWGYQLEDLDGNGKKEVVCKDRYGPDNILRFQKGRMVFANYDYPGYFLPKAGEIKTRTYDPNLTNLEKLQEEEYGDWLPVFLYADRLGDGLEVVEKLMKIEMEDNDIKPLDKKKLDEKFSGFKAKVRILQGGNSQKIRDLRGKIPFVSS